MSLRSRKLVGTVACVGFLIVYCLIAMAVGGVVVDNTPRPVHFIYFVLAGLAWLPVVMWLIGWMQREPA